MSTASTVLFYTHMARAPAPNSMERKKMKPDGFWNEAVWHLSLQGINRQKIKIILVRAHLTFLSGTLRIQKDTWDKLHSVLLTLQARDMLKKLFYRPYPPVPVASCLPYSFQPFNPLQLSPYISGKETNKQTEKQEKEWAATAEMDLWLAGSFFPTLQGPSHPSKSYLGAFL